ADPSRCRTCPNPGYPNPGYPGLGYPGPGYPGPGYWGPGNPEPGSPDRFPDSPGPFAGPDTPAAWRRLAHRRSACRRAQRLCARLCRCRTAGRPTAQSRNSRPHCAFREAARLAFFATETWTWAAEYARPQADRLSRGALLAVLAALATSCCSL